jgi:hypothetical protein
MKKTIKIQHFKIAPIIGFGCWRDDYTNSLPHGGYCWNIILLCFRIQIGELYFQDNNIDNDYDVDFGGILKIK